MYVVCWRQFISSSQHLASYQQCYCYYQYFLIYSRHVASTVHNHDLYLVNTPAEYITSSSSSSSATSILNIIFKLHHGWLMFMSLILHLLGPYKYFVNLLCVGACVCPRDKHFSNMWMVDVYTNILLWKIGLINQDVFSGSPGWVNAPEDFEFWNKNRWSLLHHPSSTTMRLPNKHLSLFSTARCCLISTFPSEQTCSTWIYWAQSLLRAQVSCQKDTQNHFALMTGLRDHTLESSQLG